MLLRMKSWWRSLALSIFSSGAQNGNLPKPTLRLLRERSYRATLLLNVVALTLFTALWYRFLDETALPTISE